MGEKAAFKCRNCNGEHWTSKCPWRDTVLGGGKVTEDKKITGAGGSGMY